MRHAKSDQGWKKDWLFWRPRTLRTPPAPEPLGVRDWLLLILSIACMAYAAITYTILVRDVRLARACADAGYDDYYIGYNSWCIQASPLRLVPGDEVMEDKPWMDRIRDRLQGSGDGFPDGVGSQPRQRGSSAESEPTRGLFWPRVPPLHSSGSFLSWSPTPSLACGWNGLGNG